MLIAKRLTKTYHSEPILKDIEFKIGNNQKIGIVGRNGCGKTTLFQLISGEIVPTEGNIDIYGEKVGYVPQELSFPDEMIGEMLEKKLDENWEFYKVETLIDQLKFENYDHYQKIYTLSEGQKMKLKLIDVLLEEPTILLIDEPTNHLDIDGILWFEDYIKHLEKAVVMISHDRSFLNNTVDEIWEIESTGITRFGGNYDFYKTEKLKMINKWDEEYVLFLKKKAQLEKLLERARTVGFGKKKGKAVSAAKKRIDREIIQNKKEKYEIKKIKNVEFFTDTREGKLMVKADCLTKSFGSNVVFEDLSFEIRGREKVWLFGPNGGGKTTLVKLIMGEEKPNSGFVKVGENVRIGYFAQKQAHLDYEANLFDHFIQDSGCPYNQAYGILKKFLFDSESLKKRIKHLSPGERARFAFAVFAYKDYDLLILDEPTNHLDIETKEVIEQSLRDYNGTLLLVSHDRYFVEKVGVEKLLNLKNNTLELL